MPEYRGPRGTPEAEAAFAKWCADHKARVERQRTAFHALHPNNAKDRFRKAMLDRAWELLDVGECEAADALLEFLPEQDADKLLDELFGD